MPAKIASSIQEQSIPLPRIQTPRHVYKAFEYPQYFQYFKDCVSTVWKPDTVDMTSDVNDFKLKATEDEREVIQGILRGFVIMETHIGDFWADNVTKYFPKHEIIAACRGFAFFESIHAWAYSHLADTLGLNKYDAFLSDPVVSKKIDRFLETMDDITSLAVFSGAGEGFSLFGAFAVLLSLSRDGRFKSISQLISWSAIDEDSHSLMGCELANSLIAERPLSTKQKDNIYIGFNDVMENEEIYIRDIFHNKTTGEQRQLKHITPEQLIDYMHIRGNNRLKFINLDPIFKVSGEGYKVKEWFELETLGQTSNDFFHQGLDGGNYTSLLSQDYSAYDYSRTNLNFRD